MAISLKNIDDRVKILEDVRIGRNTVYTCICEGEWSDKNPFQKLKVEQNASFVDLNKSKGEMTILPGSYLINAELIASIGKQTLNQGQEFWINLTVNKSNKVSSAKSWTATFNSVSNNLQYLLELKNESIIGFDTLMSGNYTWAVRFDSFSLSILKL